MCAQTEKEVKQMNKNGGAQAFLEACQRGKLDRVLEKYLESCRITTDENDTPIKKSKTKPSGKFPNIAGLCRYYRISVEDIELIAKKFPTEIARLYAVFEDEALNSGLPPAVLSAYLKKRLGYDRDMSAEADAAEICVRFEHDVYEDGE